MSQEMSSRDEEIMSQDADAGPPVLQECVRPSGASGNNEMEAPEVDPENMLRSPPKLQPAVGAKITNEESTKSPFKPLVGSMKNTPASLSIIDGPSAIVGKSTRSTRSSIDPAFAAKQRSFLNKVHNALSVRTDGTSSCESDEEVVADEEEASDDRSPEYIPGLEGIPRRIMLNGSSKRRREDSPLSKGKTLPGINPEHSINNVTSNEATEPSPKKKVPPSPVNGRIRDIFCWSCHREDAELGCASCPRAYHNRCLRRPSIVDEWVCPECVSILKAENQETRSKALKMLTLDQLCKLLLFAVDRMKLCSGADIFENPVDLDKFPTYKDYIVNPMHLSLLEKNIKRKMYGSTEAFVADCSWIVHNCVIFNSFNSKLSSISKNILKVCRHEMAEIENCPDCYIYAYTEDDNWFIQVCQKPHVLVWAKLKGFPFWPAKVVRANADAVDVRFFGAHDRAWVPARDCYLYSQENPNPNAPSKVPPTNPQIKKRNPRNNLDICIKEVELHIELLQQRFSTFQYAALRVPVNPKKLDHYLNLMLPDFASAESGAANKTTKNILTKRPSFDSKSSGPSIKRMKADSSSPQPTNLMQLLKTSLGAKENGGCIPIKGIDESEVKADATPASKDSVENRVPAPKENGTLKENGKPQLISISKSMAVTIHTVTPGQSNTFITPLTTSNATSIAELRLKKKDARKIGLVDRLQEKLGLLISQCESPKDESVANSTEENESDSCSEEQTPVGKKDLKEDERKSDKTFSAEESCQDVSLKKTEETPVNCDPQNVKKNLFAGGEIKKSTNLLKVFNLDRSQPKLVLEKLVLTPQYKPSTKIDTQVSPVKSETISTDDEDEACESPTVDGSKKTVVSETESTSEDVDKPAELSSAEVDTLPAIDPKSTSESADSVTSTTSSTPTASLAAKIARKSCNQSDSLSKWPAGTENKLVIESGSKTLKSTANSSTVKQGAKVTEQVITGSTAPNVIVDSTVQPKAEPLPEVSEESESPSNLNIEPKNAQTVTKKTDTAENSSVSLKLKNKQSKSIHPKEKIVKKQFSIRAKPISELKDNAVKTSISKSSEKIDLDDKDSFVSSTLASASDSSSMNDTEDALKSLLSKNVTVRLETPTTNKRGASMEPEKLLVLPSSSERTAMQTVSLSLPNAKATTVVVQSPSATKQWQSPPRNSPSSVHTTSPTQRLIHGATSVLKVKNKSPNDGSRDQPITLRAPRIITVTSNNGATKFLNSTSPSVLAASIAKPPTIVAVSQAPASIPVIRRLLPKAIPLSVGTSVHLTAKSVSSAAQPTESHIGSLVSLDSSTKALNPRISIRPLITSSITSTASAVPKTTNCQDSLLKTSEINSLKTTAAASRVSVGPLHLPALPDGVSKLGVSYAPSLREMPPLSIASVCSLRPLSSVQTNAGSNLPQTSLSSQVHISSTESPCEVLVAKGPVSSELRSQANKVTEVFMGCLKDCLSDMGNMGSLEAQVRCLQLDIEVMQWKHKQEMEELRHNTELIISEIQDRLKVESQQAVNIAVANAMKEKEAAITATKEKQWCAFCKKEAMFYCCWNTSYCDYSCQQNHWPVHSVTCTQNSSSSVEHDPLTCMENGPAQPASMGRITISHKEVLSPPLLKKR